MQERQSVSKLATVQDQRFLKEFLELHNPSPSGLFPLPTLLKWVLNELIHSR